MTDDTISLTDAMGVRKATVKLDHNTRVAHLGEDYYVVRKSELLATAYEWGDLSTEALRAIEEADAA